MATRKGMRIIPRGGNSLSDFTPFKVYIVLAGCGDANLNSMAQFYGKLIHTEESCNVLDDRGAIRYVTLDFFRDMSEAMGVLK